MRVRSPSKLSTYVKTYVYSDDCPCCLLNLIYAMYLSRVRGLRVRVSRRRAILKLMVGSQGQPRHERECDIVYCEHIGLSGFPCDHRVCGHCMIRMITILNTGTAFEYFLDCPCCRHQYSVSEHAIKILLHRFGTDNTMSGVQCGCKTCKQSYILKLLPCPDGCVCAESEISHTAYYNVDSDTDGGDMDSDTDGGDMEIETGTEPDTIPDAYRLNVCFLDNNGDSDSMQRVMHVH
jgi:hypothetical protein